MKLAIDHSDGAYAVSVPCYVCSSMHQLSDSVMDLDGPAFKAYYCRSCLPERMKGHKLRCTRHGCTHCPTYTGGVYFGGPE